MESKQHSIKSAWLWYEPLSILQMNLYIKAKQRGDSNKNMDLQNGTEKSLWPDASICRTTSSVCGQQNWDTSL